MIAPTAQELREAFRGLNGTLVPDYMKGGTLRNAAVLVPIVNHADGMTVLFTQRTAHLAAHAGQISFPGGRIEPGDPTPEAAALRETTEEIGLPATHIEVLGRLPSCTTRTGFHIVPVVSLLHPPLALCPNPDEVAEIFELPLSYLLTPDVYRRESMIFNEQEVGYHVIEHQNRRIWGATASILVDLHAALQRLALFR